jgi:hypothetical protein
MGWTAARREAVDQPDLVGDQHGLAHDRAVVVATRKPDKRNQ